MTSLPRWVSSHKSYIWIFNVGRGLSIFIRTGLNQGIIYDFGCSKAFSPTDFLAEHILPYIDDYKDCKIAQAIISHPHADHISEIQCIPQTKENNKMFYPCLLTCPHDKPSNPDEALDWSRINNPDDSKENTDIYKSLYAPPRTLPLQTILYDDRRSVPNLEYGIYYIRPPIIDQLHSDDQDYGNGISLVLYYRYGIHTLLIPGDITPEAMKLILSEDEGMEKRYTNFDRRKSDEHPDWNERTSNQPSLSSMLKNLGLSILVAPHHGLESGFSEELYESIKNNKPDLVVISEKRHKQESDGSVDNYYQTEDGASGLSISIEGDTEDRYSVSTRDGHHILISFEGTGGYPEVYLDRDPEKLLDVIS